MFVKSLLLIIGITVGVNSFAQDKEKGLILESKIVTLLNNAPLGEFHVLCSEDNFYESFEDNSEIVLFGAWIKENQLKEDNVVLMYQNQFEVKIFSVVDVSKMKFSDDEIPTIFVPKK